MMNPNDNTPAGAGLPSHSNDMHGITPEEAAEAADTVPAGPSRHSNGITIAQNLPHPPQTAAPKRGGAGGSSKTKRSRWATRKMTVKSSNKKRLSIMGRANNKSLASEKKRASAGSESLPADGEDDFEEDDEGEAETDGPGPRTIYFNLPLPDEAKDENGMPTQSYARNKIRTAKYTPLSFIPKNLYFQFQNIANIFFLFLVILAVSSPCPP